jgi:hypothetical protein
MSLSAFEWFAPEILERIAFFTGADRHFVPGPPTHLVPLLCTSRTIHDVLAFRRNSHLYADLFRVKFDCGAPTRRLGKHWLTTSCLSSELRKRFMALKRIKRRAFGHTDDLWTAYVLMMEGDGRNETHLIEWAGIREYLMMIILHRARGVENSSRIWFLESEEAALVVWLFWMTSSPSELNAPMENCFHMSDHLDILASIRREDPILQRIVLRALHPLLVAGFQVCGVTSERRGT